MNCNDFKINISAFVDGEISENEKLEITEHIKSCEKCKMIYETYKKLSLGIKETEEKLPEDFRIKFPEEKRKVINIFRGHEGVASAIAAAVALIIFAGGITGDKYKAPVVGNSPETDTYILKTDKQLPEATMAPKATTQVIVQKQNEKTSAEITSEVATRIYTEENAEEVMQTQKPYDETVAQDVAAPERASGGGGGSSAASSFDATEFDEIKNFQMPDSSEFSDEGVYKYLKDKLETLQRNATENSNYENLVSEFELLKEEINNAKK